MIPHTLSKKERHRTIRFSRDEPYARASDEALVMMCLSGGRPILKQSVSASEKPTKSTTIVRTTPSLSSISVPLEEPLLTRSISMGNNTISSLPIMPRVSQSHVGSYPILEGGPRKDSAPKVAPFKPDSCGVFTFRPLKGQFTANREFTTKMAPYCKVEIGHHHGKTLVAKNEGYASVWNDAIALERRHSEDFAKIKVKDYSKFRFYNDIGEARIPLSEITSQGKISKWYPIYKKNNPTGQVFLEINFEPQNVASYL